MSGDVFALLVGIDDYGGNPKPLSGCNNDVTALETVLEGRVAEGKLHLRILRDRDATRQNIIDAFTTHLGQAAKGDVALFAFSGHGSFERVEERFWYLEPTGQNQTIVCADSRAKRSGDLADKELNELIRGVAERDPHVVVILDCCHSGGGTRDPEETPPDVHVRLAPPMEGLRAVESYPAGIRRAVEAAEDAAQRGGGAPEGGSYPRHIALSACESTQLSKEVSISGVFRGAFSASLERALTTLADNATYRDLLRAAANDVRNRVEDQDPVLFAEDEDVDQAFLGGAIQPRATVITLEEEHGRWFVDVGAVHGVQAPSDGQTTVLAVRPGGAATERAAPQLGTVRVTAVEPTRSLVEAVGFTPQAGTLYNAEVVSVPRPPASVVLRGEPAEALQLVRAALGASTYVRESAAGPSQGELVFVVLATTAGLTVARADGTPLTDAVPADAAGAQRTVGRLDHLVRWHLLKNLDNPTSTLSGKVTIEVVATTKGEPPVASGVRPPIALDATGVIRRSYERSGDGWEKPYVFIYVHNNSDRDLYCTLLDLTDRFRSHSKLLPVTKVAAGATAVSLGGKPIDLSLPDARIKAGGTEVRDWLKVIASETRFETDGYDLPILDGVLDRVDAATRSGGAVGAREVGAETGAETAGSDWTTAMVCLVTERPSDGAEVSATAGTELADRSVRLEPHTALAAARVRLAATPNPPPGSDRAAMAPMAPMALVADPAVAVPLAPTSKRMPTERPPDHLELFGEIDSGRVTADHPLRLRLEVPIAPDDIVLAVARDGDLFIPLGTGTRVADGSVRVELQRLPHGDADDTRGRGRSIKVFFQRVLGSKLTEDVLPRLSVATVAGGGQSDSTVHLDPDPVRASAAVGAAQSVLLVVHGLVGDSRALLPALHRAIGDRYDVTLAFDFDAVGASIEETASALAARLDAFGLGDAPQRIDVVAVSTGALVVRWFAEQLGGAGRIRRAVLAGPPNEGSSSAGIPGWATNMLAIGLNAFAAVPWPAAALARLVGAIDKGDTGVDGLQPGSAALATLAAGSAAASYVVVAGNAGLARVAEADRDDGTLGRLLANLGRAGVDLTFFRRPNDLVASTTSIATLPTGLAPAPQIVEVACDHLSYLSEAVSLEAIARALT